MSDWFAPMDEKKRYSFDKDWFQLLVGAVGFAAAVFTITSIVIR